MVVTFLEATCWVLYWLSKKMVKILYRFSKFLHRVRERRLDEFARDCCPYAEYRRTGGHPLEYWDYVIWQRRYCYAMMILVFVLIVVGMILIGDTPPC